MTTGIDRLGAGSLMVRDAVMSAPTLWGWHHPAAFSADERHRYTLTRDLEAGARRIRAMTSHGRPAVTEHTYSLTPKASGESSQLRSLTERRCLFVMLNPSTATDTVDDPTIKRCSRFAASWGFDRLMVCNLFSLRSTDPRALYGDETAEGDPENLTTILTVAEHAHLIVCGWGTHGVLRGRGEYVARELRAAGHQLHALKLTKDGQPGHPLYLRSDLVPFEWRAS